ncbi:MAG: 5-formyltetrahydrofolate cyclo-ligase [Thermoleophilaceae bacterium]|nr:5-formyltetrahydrofolate cyclo-ligase [Thermoleophilaceae bacterium]
MRSKDDVRADVWQAMEREGVARFPGARGRIPNFVGAERAAERLAEHPAWTSAETLKANPDSPQTRARRLALAQGKVVLMAVPRLRDRHPFRLLDPRRLAERERREAATIKGALRHGKAIGLGQVPDLDLVLAGSVAVNTLGARIGKGGGFSDLEYGLLFESGRIDPRTRIATTVHPLQILRDDLPMTAHDIPVNLVATPAEVIEVDGAYDRPTGILRDHLQPRQLLEIPVLEQLGYAG